MQLSRAKQIAESLIDAMRPYCEQIEIAGSIRRGAADVKDVEIVVVPFWNYTAKQMDTLFDVALESNMQNQLFEFWAKHPIRSPSLSLRWIKPGTSEIIDWQPKPDGKYWRGLINDEIKLDLFIARPENFGIIHLIRTGSAEFSQAVVTHAKRRGTPCVDGFLTENGRNVSTPTERDAFDYLGLEYVEPCKRRDGRDVRDVNKTRGCWHENRYRLRLHHR